MPVRGKAKSMTATTNRVLSGIGGLVNFKGRISLTRSMDQATTAAIEAQDVPADRLGTVIKRPGTKIRLFGDQLLVESCSYTVNRIYPNDSRFETYNVSIRLKQPPEDVEVWDGRGGRGITLRLTDRIADGENSAVLFTSGYREAELTFGEQGQSGGDEPQEGEPRTIFRLKNAKTETFREGDDKPDDPPPNTFVLRDFSSNFDESGPKKMIKIARRKNGQLESEEITTYGFAYLARELDYADGEDIYDNNPGRFWKPIEYKKTVYSYARVGASTFSVTVRPPSTGSQAAPVRFIVHPDYTQFAQQTFSGVAIRSNAEYLTRQVTTGWKLVRFLKEPYKGDTSATVEADDPIYPLFDFIKTPYYAETLYSLRSTRRQYDNAALPFRVEWVDYKSLPLSIKTAFATQDITEDGRVAILYPDPGYVEPMFISAESSMSSSFEWRLNPDEEANPDAFIPGTNRLAPPPRFITGEESYSTVRRTILNDERYTEYEVSYSSQDPGFDNSAELFTFREVSGTPPEPQYRVQEYESLQVPNGQVMLSSSVPTEQYFITAVPDSLAEDYIEKGGSVSIPEVDNLKDALDKVELDLKKAYAQNSSSSITDIGFHPNIRPGDRCIAGERLPGGAARLVTGCTNTIEFHGTNNVTGTLLATTAGTQLTVGPWKPVTIRLDKRPQQNPGNEQQSFEESIDINITSTPGDVGVIFPVLPNRRNF